MMNQQLDCEYIAHENGIHEFITHAPTRQAIDIQLETVFKVIADMKPDEPFLMLNDITKSGVPPLRYAMMRSKQLVKKHFDGAPTQQNPTFIAYVVKSNSVINTFKFFIEQLGRGMVMLRVFEEHASAREWLINQQIEMPLR